MHADRIAPLLAMLGLPLLAACSGPAPQPTGASQPATPVAAAPKSPPVPAAMGKRAAGEENQPLLAWRAFGTEPFWNVRVDAGRLIFTTPEDQAGRILPATLHREGGAIVLSGNDGDTAYRLTLTPATCSDGMSDSRYTLVATFDFGAAHYAGCAEAAK